MAPSRWLPASAAILAAALAGCAPLQEVQIADVTRPTTLVLEKRFYQGSIHRLSVTATGSLAGSAEIQLILNDSIHEVRQINGQFDVSYSGDWYYDTAELRYVPEDVSSGHVTLEYAFHSSP